MARPLTSGPAAEDLEAARGTDAGWWFTAASKAFKFLERDGGYVLSTVRYHQAGHYLKYVGSRYQISIELEPGWLSMHGTVVVMADLRPGTYPRTTSLIRILETRGPGTDWHREVLSPHSKRKQILRALKSWGEGIRMLAPDLVAGGPLLGLAWD